MKAKDTPVTSVIIRPPNLRSWRDINNANMKGFGSIVTGVLIKEKLRLGKLPKTCPGGGDKPMYPPKRLNFPLDPPNATNILFFQNQNCLTPLKI